MAARLLLAVFLPMLLVSSFHIHAVSSAGDDGCNECVQHQCHGHLTQLTTELHECVLCQFLSLTYTSAAVLLSVAFICLITVVRFRYAQFVCNEIGNSKCSRAPPFNL